MILVDAGPLIALLDRRDSAHVLCVEALANLRGGLVTTWPVLAEAFYLLGDWEAQERLWNVIASAPIDIAAMQIEEHRRMRELMAKYADLPMDLADASLVAIGERLGIKRVFTLDARDFGIYRPRHARRFEIVPSPGS